MNVIFVEPAFPAYQRQFVRGLHAAGAAGTPYFTNVGRSRFKGIEVEAEYGIGGFFARGNASFIDGLSRHSHAVWTDVPGIVQFSRTWATDMVCASIVVSRRSTQSWSWIQRMASVKIPTSTTVGTWW